MFPLFPFLLSKTLLYWVDISANFACAAHTHKKCAAFSFNMLFIFDLTLDCAQFRLPEEKNHRENDQEILQKSLKK